MHGSSKKVVKTIICFLFLSLFFASIFCFADCTVTPKSISMDYTSGPPQVNELITFTVEAETDCNGPLYYYFSYKGGYGTDSYETNDWVNMRDVFWSTSNSVTHRFSEAGSYVVVAWISPTESAPNPVPLIGTSVTVVEGGGGDCVFDSAALNVTVSDAISGSPISGVTVTASGQSATTSSSGTATLAHLPTDTEVTVSVSASGYVAQSSSVLIECGQAQDQGFALLRSD
ncbi:MAG: carboxypeptidase regulatory-like domain-containing protein, partial [Deltaproteobacteria bacterium]